MVGETVFRDTAITAMEIARKEVAMKDVLGQELQFGDIVAYPGRRGSKLWINTARIESYDPVEVSVIPNSNSQDEEGRRVILRRTDRFVRVRHGNV